MSSVDVPVGDVLSWCSVGSRRFGQGHRESEKVRGRLPRGQCGCLQQLVWFLYSAPTGDGETVRMIWVAVDVVHLVYTYTLYWYF